MKILIVTSYNNRKIAPFVAEQVGQLRRRGVACRYLLVRGHGICGYLRNLPRLRRIVAQWQPDIVHAHYGLCGLLATLQHQRPVVVTFHGSDLTMRLTRPLSRRAGRRAKHCIFVSPQLAAMAHAQADRSTILPGGVDTATFAPMDTTEARRQLGLDPDGRYVLFSSDFKTHVKNYTLARKALRLCHDTTLLELKNRDRRTIMLMLNAANLLLLTSRREGSPQIVKEAIACNCPIVSVDVGDVAQQVEGIDACHIVAHHPQAIADACKKLTDNPVRSNGRPLLEARGLTLDQTTDKLITLYNDLCRQ